MKVQRVWVFYRNWGGGSQHLLFTKKKFADSYARKVRRQERQFASACKLRGLRTPAPLDIQIYREEIRDYELESH